MSVKCELTHYIMIEGLEIPHSAWYALQNQANRDKMSIDLLVAKWAQDSMNDLITFCKEEEGV